MQNANQQRAGGEREATHVHVRRGRCMRVRHELMGVRVHGAATTFSHRRHQCPHAEPDNHQRHHQLEPRGHPLRHLPLEQGQWAISGATLAKVVQPEKLKAVHYEPQADSGPPWKYTRAEPVSALYEQGKVKHVGAFPKLEDQLCTWLPGEDSPDRLDALVWAVTNLTGRVSSYVDFV